MAYKINGTTVVDNSRNVCACCVTSCCITASDRMDAPSGTTAQRPSSPATGSIYFDTDEGSLISYNGTEWASVGGSSGLEYVNQSNYGETWTLSYIDLTNSNVCRGKESNAAGGQWKNQSVCSINTDWLCNNPMAPSCSGTKTTCLINDSLCAKCQSYLLPGYSDSFGVCKPYAGGVYNGFNCQLCSWNSHVFPDGTYCSSAYSHRESGCFKQGLTRSLIITPKGGAAYSESIMNNQLTTSCCIRRVSREEVQHFPYAGLGKNGPIVELGVFSTGLLYEPYTDICKGIHSWCILCLELEADAKTVGENKFNVCCYAAASGFTNKRVMCFHDFYCTGLRMCCICMQSPNCLGRDSVTPDTCMVCFPFSRFTVIPKDVTFDHSNPDKYTQLLEHDTQTGICLMGSANAAVASIAYARNLCLCYNCGRPGPIVETNCISVPHPNQHTTTFSDDGCFMYHFYFPFNCACCFFKQCTSPTSCCIRHCETSIPAVEKINLTTGAVVCSIYYCEFYDCDNGNTDFPYIASYTPARNTLCSNFRCKTARMESQPCSHIPSAAGFMGSFHQITSHSGTCTVRPCDCSTHFYIMDAGLGAGTSVTLFNENTMNFEWFLGGSLNFAGDGLQTQCGAMRYARAEVGCCSSDIGAQCLCAKMKEYITSKGCTCRCNYFNSLWDLNCFVYCDFATVDSGCRGPRLGSHLNQLCGSYINPVTNHLVCLSNITVCCTGNCCVLWMGVICYDLRNNFCVSAVDTIWPVSGDKCLWTLCCSLGFYCNNCWCGSGGADLLNYDCRRCTCGYCNSFMVGSTANQRCGPKYIDFKTYSSADKVTAGAVFRIAPKDCWGNCGGTLSSSCQLCPACTDSPFLGYFGPLCKGSCVWCNTCTGCNTGIRCVKTMSSITNVPFCQPLCCSQMFERNDQHKDMVEFLLGCNCLALWYYAICHANCCYECAVEKQQSCFYATQAPCLHTKVDITCQYTLGCQNVYTWGSTCWCSGCRWIIADLETTTFCLMYCNNQSSYCLICADPVCWCTTVCSSCYPYCVPGSGCTMICFQEFLECDKGNLGARCEALFGPSGCCLSCPGFTCAKAYCNILCSCGGNRILDNITSSAFGNCTYHSDNFLFTPRVNNVIAGNTAFSSRCCGIHLNVTCQEKGFLVPTSNTNGKGSAGMLIEWFNRDYAMIC